MHIGKRLRELRTVRGMTQAKVSEDITSATHYSNIEGGHFTPLQDTLTLLAKRLAVPVAYLTNSYLTDNEVADLLEQYEQILDNGNVELANDFVKTHGTSFEYIPSLQQELHFNLLQCLTFYKAKEFDGLQKQYEEKIRPYVDCNSVRTLNPSIQEKYNYISGLYHYIIGNYKESIQFFIHVLKNSEDPQLHARLTFNIALAHLRLFHYTEALNYSEKARDHYLHLHNWEKTAECYNLMAVLYKEQNQLETAELYIHKGLQISNDCTTRIYALLLHNLALIYQKQVLFDQALETIDNAITLKKTYSPDSLFSSYQTKLDILLHLQDEVAIAPTMNYARQTCTSPLEKHRLQIIEGKQHLQQQRYEAYEKCFNQSIDYFFKHEHWKDLIDIAEDFSVYYGDKKHYKKAFELNKLALLALKKINLVF